MIIKSKPIEELESEAEDDLKLRSDRTGEDSANTPFLFNKYHRQYRIVSSEYIQAGNSLLRLRRERWFYYTGKADPEVYKDNPLDHKIMKSDLKMFIDSDDEVIKLTYIVELLDMKKKYIKDKLEEINRRSFHIGNIIKTQYFKHGIN